MRGEVSSVPMPPCVSVHGQRRSDGNDSGAAGQSSHAFPVPKIRVDVAQREAEEVLRAQLRSVSPENWAGGRLSARGLDALQSIRDAAQQHLTLRQNSDSPVGSITESRSPSPRSRTRRKSARSRAAAGKSPLRSPTSPLVRYRPPEQEPELEEHGVLKSSILPLPPNRICGLPARSLRFQKKTPEPAIPMYAKFTSETEGACLDRTHKSVTNRERHESAGRRHLGGFVDAQIYQNQDLGAHTERKEVLRFSTEGRTNTQTICFPCETSGLSIALAPTRRSRLSCPRWSCLKTKHCFGAYLQTSHQHLDGVDGGQRKAATIRFIHHVLLVSPTATTPIWRRLPARCACGGCQPPLERQPGSLLRCI